MDVWIQIGMFRSIRVDHTNCLQVDIKTHSFKGVVVYYESMERKLLKPIYECRCTGRLQTKG